LKEVPIEGDEVLGDQTIAGYEVVIERASQQRTDFIVAVVTNGVSFLKPIKGL
jgi:predicted Zn-dependent protease